MFNFSCNQNWTFSITHTHLSIFTASPVYSRNSSKLTLSSLCAAQVSVKGWKEFPGEPYLNTSCCREAEDLLCLCGPARCFPSGENGQTFKKCLHVLESVQKIHRTLALLSTRKRPQKLSPYHGGHWKTCYVYSTNADHCRAPCLPPHVASSKRSLPKTNNM